jgi:hypothetical protein
MTLLSAGPEHLRNAISDLVRSSSAESLHRAFTQLRPAREV